MEVDESQNLEVLIVEDSSEFKLTDDLKEAEAPDVENVASGSAEEPPVESSTAQAMTVDDAAQATVGLGHLKGNRTGIATGNDIGDVSFVYDEENRRKREERAKRFGIRTDEKIDDVQNAAAGEVESGLPVSEEDLQKLYSYFGIDPTSAAHKAKYRLTALFVYGLSDMSTADVEEYFKGDHPASIEWINDQSCTITWRRASDAARCLLRFSKPCHVNRLTTADSDEGEQTQGKEMDTSSVGGAKQEEEEVVVLDCKDFVIPPGTWRVGKKCDQSKLILLRFAEVHDVKTKGAMKQSIYYRKYGNPHFGNLRGYISESLKRKYIHGRGDERQGREPRDLRRRLQDMERWKLLRDDSDRTTSHESWSEEKEEAEDEYEEYDESTAVTTPEPGGRGISPSDFWPRMRADEEIERQRRKKRRRVVQRDFRAQQQPPFDLRQHLNAMSQTRI